MEVKMNFIETIFGIAPDAGSGTLEALLVLAPLLMASLVALLGRRTTNPTRRPSSDTPD